MNKWSKRLATAVLAATFAMPAAVYAEMSNKDMMTDDGMTMMEKTMTEKTMFDSPKTMMMNGMTYVQLRDLAMERGYGLAWDGMDKKITIRVRVMTDEEQAMDDGTMEDMDMNEMAAADMTAKSKIIHLYVGRKTFEVDGMKMEWKEAPYVNNGRTYLCEEFIDMYLMN